MAFFVALDQFKNFVTMVDSEGGLPFVSKFIEGTCGNLLYSLVH